VTTPASSRGGSTPPRPPAAVKPQHWFTLRPGLFDITAATGLPRVAPRPAQPLPVEPCTRLRAAPRRRRQPAHGPLTGPGPHFGPQYAMGTDLDEPLIIASVTADGTGPPCPLLVDGCHRLYKAARLGREKLPSSRADRCRDPGDPPRRGPRPAPAGRRSGGPAMITVSVWHNVAHDAEGRHAAMLDGYQPGHPMVRVFAYQADPGGRSPEAVAEEAFAVFNGHPRDAGGEELSVGDVVVIGEVALAVGRLPAGSRSTAL
jgi:hypothetical protein